MQLDIEIEESHAIVGKRIFHWVPISLAWQALDTPYKPHSILSVKSALQSASGHCGQSLLGDTDLKNNQKSSSSYRGIAFYFLYHNLAHGIICPTMPAVSPAK